MINIKSDSTVNLYEKLQAITSELLIRAVAEEVEGAERPVAETIEHDGLMLRKVDRDGAKGDYVRFISVDSQLTKIGVFYELLDGTTYRPGHQYSTYDINSWCENTVYEIFEVVGAHPSVTELQDVPPFEHASVKSANQQRYETIQRTREFVEDWTTKNRDSRQFSNNDFPHGLWFADSGSDSPLIEVEFHVNDRKRTVVALIKNIDGYKLRAKGIAKCMPGDVFHADIGKAIALCKALQIEIPKEFVDAVQPDVRVIGMRAKLNKQLHDVDKGRVFELARSGFYPLTGEFCSLNSLAARNSNIIDDTNAQYGTP